MSSIKIYVTRDEHLQTEDEEWAANLTHGTSVAHERQPRASSLRATDETQNGPEQGLLIDDRRYTVLSLGAGVQSTTLALMLASRDPVLEDLGYGVPDVAIFADTGWEPDYVYQHLRWLDAQVPFIIETVSSGDIRKNLYKGKTTSGHNFLDIPLFSIDDAGRKGMLRRQCTDAYKIRPIYQEVRRRIGMDGKRFPSNAGPVVEMWMGISSDEVFRMRQNREKWVVNRYPLIEAGISREDCQAWFAGQYTDRELLRSACVICPYRSDAEWLELKHHEPGSYEDAVKFDGWLRERRVAATRELEGQLFVHASRDPLSEAVEAMEDDPENINHFNEECDGLCGV